MEKVKRQEKIRVMFIIDYMMGLAGTENQIIKMIRHIDTSSFEIHLVCLLDSEWLTELRKKFSCKVTALHYNMFNHKRPANVLSAIKLVQVIRNSNPAIVLTFFKTSYILGTLAARLAKVDTIVSTRRDYGLWLDKWSVLPIRLANCFVKRIVTNSHAVAELVSRVERFDANRIDVIYNGIDIRSHHPSREKTRRLKKEIGIPDNVTTVGIVAGLKPMKRHETFIRAAKRIVSRRQDVHFVIVGDGARRRPLTSLVEELELIQHVHFVGNQENVLPFLNMFDIGINCSSNEGLSNAIMEYMAHGVPCIVSRAGGNTELIRDGVNGCTFELGNDRQLADCTIRLLDDPERRERYISESRIRIEAAMTTDRMIENYETYFRKLLNCHRTGKIR